MELLGSIFDALSSDGNGGGCEWICDSCGAYMNSQPEFSVSSGSWCCKECGSWNDVSEDNIVDEEERNREEKERLRELGIDPYDD